MKHKSTLLACSVAFFLGACSVNSAKEANEPNKLQSGINKANWDLSTPHHQDFYQSVNGNWLKNMVIPADKSNYGSFTQLADDAQKAIQQIIENAAKTNAAHGSEAQKIADLYSSYMNEKLAENLGISPISADLSAINQLSNHSQMAQYLGKSLLQGAGSPFGFYVNNDAKNSSQYMVYIYQAGLGLPDRDYYLKQDQKSQKLRQQYQSYMEQMFELAGDKTPQTSAAAVLALETKLAQIQWDRVENRDANKTYNRKTYSQLKAELSGFDFDSFAGATGLNAVKEFVVNQPSYLENFANIFKQTSISNWQAYAKMNLINAAAPYLNANVANKQFGFYEQKLKGIEQQKPRWKKGVTLVEGVLGEAVGKIYVAQNFKPQAKERMEKLVANLIKAFEVSINELEWMSAATKIQAQAKLAKFTTKIGYPEKWRDYSALTIQADDLLGNVRRSYAFEYQTMLAKLGKPIDKNEWHMTPQTVNAYYNPVNNEVVFPAAILQPPFFNLAADDAVNYGSIGAVIGHEISHGFDDQGSKYDGDGNLKNWWTAADRQAFEQRTQKLVAQYNAYKPFPDANVNGEFTLGENIGDLGGLTVAYKAFKLSLNGKNGAVIDDLTADQRFFLGWSQIWRRQHREADLRQRLITDPHSPSHYRVIGIVPNIPEFYSSFNVQKGDGMYLAPENRVKIW